MTITVRFRESSSVRGPLLFPDYPLTDCATCNVVIGDLGPKLGDGANDTGFMRLDNVRIPREHMLCRYQEVRAAGHRRCH